MDMEVSSAEPEAGAGAAGTAGPSGSGPAAAEGIDLSLDDIIKKNKKEQTNQKRRSWRQPLKNRNAAYNSGSPGSQSWGPRNLQGTWIQIPQVTMPSQPSWLNAPLGSVKGRQEEHTGNEQAASAFHGQSNTNNVCFLGPSQFRGGFRKQQFYKKRFWNGGTKPGQNTPGRPSGRSPLNRSASAEQAKQQDTTGGSEGGAAADALQGPSPRVKRFGLTGGPPLLQRPFRKNQRPPFFQKQSRFNFRQRQFSAERRPPRRQWWQPQPNVGAVLTVSVSNCPSGHANGPAGAKHPFLRGRGARAARTRRQPKGVPLRFNFHTMANQTSLTLNERFSGLRHKHRFAALQNTGRMVTLS